MTAKEAIESNRSECRTLDYKSEIPSDKIHRIISSFANTEGGTVIIGVVEKEGYPTDIVGVDKPDVDQQTIRNKIRDTVRPLLTLDIQEETFPNNKTLLVINIPKSERLHHVWENGKGVVYIRDGRDSVPMPSEQFTATLNPPSTLPRTQYYCIELTDGDVESPVELDEDTRKLVAQNQVNTLQSVRYRKENGDWHEIARTGKRAFQNIFLLDRRAEMVLEHHGSGFAVVLNHENGTREPKAVATKSDALDKMEELIREKAKNGVLVPAKYREEDVPAKPKGLLIPELHPQIPERPEYLAATIFLFNPTQVSAKEVRITVSYTEPHLCAYQASADWKEVGNGRINPRALEAQKSVHSGERLGTFKINYPRDCTDNLVFEVEIRGLDQPSTKWNLTVPKQKLSERVSIPFKQIG